MSRDLGNLSTDLPTSSERRRARRRRDNLVALWVSVSLVVSVALFMLVSRSAPVRRLFGFAEPPAPDEVSGGVDPTVEDEPDVPVDGTIPDADTGPLEENPPPEDEWVKPPFDRAAQMERALNARAVYVTIPAANTASKMDSIRKFVREHEGLNAFVMDVRDNNGSVPCAPPEGVPSKSAGSSKYPDLVKELSQEGYYLIARIVCFQDPYLVNTFPELAIRHPSGAVWKDRDGRLWLNPCDERNWEHVRNTALWAVDMGFDEIQLDYVRFPDSAAGIESVTLMPGREEYGNRGDAIVAFLNYMSDALEGKAIFSADIFGFTTIAVDDMGIGQNLERVADCVDFISPMVYPSHYFNAGIYGFELPEAHPYEVVGNSADEAFTRTVGLRAQNRPWLQDFSMRVKYGPAEVQAQINALFERGMRTFMLWNPANNFTSGVKYVPPPVDVHGR